TFMVDTESLVNAALHAISSAGDERALEQLRVDYLGKKGSLTELRKGLGSLAPEQRPQVGELINQAIRAVQEKLDARKAALQSASLQARLTAESVDVTLPGRKQSEGGLHPVTRTINRIQALFEAAGYNVAVGPEIE